MRRVRRRILSLSMRGKKVDVGYPVVRQMIRTPNKRTRRTIKIPAGYVFAGVEKDLLNRKVRVIFARQDLEVTRASSDGDS